MSVGCIVTDEKSCWHVSFLQSKVTMAKTHVVYPMFDISGLYLYPYLCVKMS